jgi:anhydro-N-acetylmuramic acid kinase
VTRAPAVPAAADALAGVRDYLARDRHLLVGLMTGTSADAVDAVLVRFEGLGLATKHTLVRHRESPFDTALRREILEVAQAQSLAPERLMALDAALGECYAAAVLELVADAGVDLAEVDAIGCHGQTVRHLPRGANGAGGLTLQLGSAAVIAERTGITVVSGFRPRDMAAGGEGAPLVPILDWWLFRSPTESRALLNLGGMANFTHLPRGAGLPDVIAFDTGPCNGILDALVTLLSDGADHRDEGGERALRGTPSRVLLDELLADPYFALAPPKSTGRERYGADYAARMRDQAARMGIADDDLLATAVALVSSSVSDAVTRFLGPRGGVDAVYASGGGVRNAALMAALTRDLKPARLESAERLGVPPQAKEALAFAFLAHQTLCGRPGNVPAATGASHPVVLGNITPGTPR